MGYKVLTVTIFLCLMKGAHVRAQCSKPNFEGNVVLSDKDISTNDFPDGSKVTFVCITGYVAVGGRSRSVTCNGNKWTELALSCETVQCETPQVIENGRYDGQEDPDIKYVYGDGVYYKCNTGFNLIGSDVIKCSEDGKFQPEPPKCIVISCPTPNVPNGNQICGKPPPYSLNNFIQYKCNDGYDIIGQDHITCTANGWSSEPPQCIGYCEPPVFEGDVTISKASEVTQKYHDGTSVIFECKSGYKQVDLKASNKTTCKDKKWSPLELKCKAQCSKPSFEGNVVLSDKDISANDFPDGSKVTFVCITGYVAVGGRSRSVTCNGNKWTELALSCERKSCGSLPDINNGKYEIPNGILFGDSVTAVKCDSPQVIENGRYDEKEDPDIKYVYGDGVNYKCNTGFNLIGSDVIKCSEDGKFQPEPPKCIVVSCPAVNVLNGNRIGGKAPPYSLNNFIQYKCNDGYDIIGQDHITCTANGWSSEPPQCIGYCEPPVFEGDVTISKASEVTQKYHEGTSVIFECKSGYKQVDLRASNKTTCKDKKWSPLELKCKGEYCDPPSIGNNVIISKPFDSKTKFLDGSKVTLECKSGYEPKDDSEATKYVTCQDTKWSPLHLRCEGYCGPPELKGNVIAKQLNSTHKFREGFRLELECESGYKPVDSKTSNLIKCEDTNWKYLHFTCTAGLSSGAIFGNLIKNLHQVLEEKQYLPLSEDTSKCIVHTSTFQDNL
ncbi:Complement factor H H factor 1 [Triplophysa tibetana]|uniref:Complement factor H H factor 1 n=1 Tax=Triplophysa tibetana TaxID=1572043 RepID=A0A5A9ND47_9TELE|nr:Complement factor H H factor 1 [Triplophysa tibetana]